MTHMTSTDLARFYQRYDLRQRLLYAAALSASLVLSAVDVAHGTITAADGAAAPAIRWFAVGFFPLAIAAWWGAQEFIVRWRDRRPPMSEDDVPNGLRIANAGFLFSVAFEVVLLAIQAIATLAGFGVAVSDWIPRATLAVFGVALVCLGNLWPRMPTHRVPGRKAANEMKTNRVWGWLMVLMGAGAVMLGLCLPLLERHHP